ncbi:MAG TPA: hypothetical protein VMI13_07350 [Solirubrobacteraceae bacterium]|nr:hypothetical protein [Solirubrobacteraceae bacterium]
MSRLLRVRSGALRLVPVLAAGACLLAACGKSAGPSRSLAPVAEQGAVSVVTGNTSRIGGSDAASDAAAVARAVYPGLTRASRPEAVVLVDEGSFQTALAASVLASLPLNAPLLFSSGGSMPGVSSEAIESLHPLGAGSLGGAQVVRVGSSASVPGGLHTLTLPPRAPAAAAAAVEQLLARATRSRPHQVIVVPTGASPALLMPVAGLAAQSGAPILFATAAGVPKATAGVLEHLDHPAIYVIGDGQLHHATMDELRHFGHVTPINGTTQLGGEDRTPTGNSIAIARFTDGSFGWGIKEPGHGLVFANAARPPDGPAAALLSASSQYGPLLVLESAERVGAAMGTYLADIQPAYTSAPAYQPVHGVYNRGWLIGDEDMISSVTQAEIDSLLAISPSKQSGEEASSQTEQSAFSPPE